MPNISPSKDNFVRTVCGDIAAQDVGFAHCHEHEFTLPGPSTEQDPDLVIDDIALKKQCVAGPARRE